MSAPVRVQKTMEMIDTFHNEQMVIDKRPDFDARIVTITQALKTQHFKSAREEELVKRVEAHGNTNRATNVRQRIRGVDTTAATAGLVPYSKISQIKKKKGCANHCALGEELLARGVTKARLEKKPDKKGEGIEGVEGLNGFRNRKAELERLELLRALQEKKARLIALEEARILKDKQEREGEATALTPEEKDIAKQAGEGVELTPQEKAPYEGKGKGFKKLTGAVFQLTEKN